MPSEETCRAPDMYSLGDDLRLPDNILSDSRDKNVTVKKIPFLNVDKTKFSRFCNFQKPCDILKFGINDSDTQLSTISENITFWACTLTTI